MASIKRYTGTAWQTLNTVNKTVGAPDGFAVQAPLDQRYIPYFKQVGIKAVRVGSTQQSPWGIYWGYNTRRAAIAYKDAGFWVQYDIVSATGGGFTNPITATSWPIFHDVVVAEAAYLESRGIHFDLLGLGNELENIIDNSTLTYQGLYDRLQQLAIDVKAVYTGKICYNFFNWPLSDYPGFQPQIPWRAGPGNFDLVAPHPYATITPPVVSSVGTFVNALWVAKSMSPSVTYTVGFNGSTCKVDLGRPDQLTSLTDYTWAGWVNAAEAKKMCLWSNCYSFTSNVGQGIYISTTNVGGVAQQNIHIFQGNAGALGGRPSFTVGQWFYLVVSQVGNIVNAWIDDTQIFMSPPAGGNTQADTPLTQVPQSATINSFFGMEGGTAFPFSGEMYNVGIWNRGLTSLERAGLKNGTYPADGLIGQYLFPTGSITPASVSFTKVYAILDSWFGQYGNRCFISEFNLDADGFKIMTLTRQQQKDNMLTMFNYMKTARSNAGATGTDNKMIYFKFNSESLQTGTAASYGFSMSNIDGTTNGMNDALLGI